jgi:hypothetical protein
MNLLISELLPMDAALDRAIPWLDDLDAFLASLAGDDERPECEEHVEASLKPAWYWPRLSVPRKVIDRSN